MKLLCTTALFRCQSPKFKTEYRSQNQFLNPGFTNGVRQFCEYQYFCYEIPFYSVCLYSPFHFEYLKSKSTQMISPQKGNSGVLSNDTLLNFGLRAHFWSLNYYYRSQNRSPTFPYKNYFHFVYMKIMIVLASNIPKRYYISGLNKIQSLLELISVRTLEMERIMEIRARRSIRYQHQF